MTAMNCTQLADAAPELALGVLSGRERAEALEHLDTCSTCRQLVNSLSGVTDELLRSFAPSIQPPAGFEARVLSAITPPAKVMPLRARRRGMIAGVAVAACIALLFAVVLGIGPSSRTAFAASEMKTANGDVVGWIYLDPDESGAVYMTLPGWADQIQPYGREGDTYSLHLSARSGVERVLPVSLDSRAAWKATLDIDPGTITSAALVDGNGHVWCRADLDST